MCVKKVIVTISRYCHIHTYVSEELRKNNRIFVLLCNFVLFLWNTQYIFMLILNFSSVCAIEEIKFQNIK